MKKRILATVLAAVMALSLLPMSALAAPRYEEEVVAETPMGEEVREGSQKSAAPAQLDIPEEVETPAEIDETPAAAELLAEGETGYNGDTLPEGPDMSGTTVTVTPENAQYTLDGAYGSINGKTIVFTGEYTDILYVNRPSKYPGSGTVYYNGYSGRTKVDSASDLKQTGVTSYTRDLNNVTLTAVDGVVIPGIQVYGCGHHHDSSNTGTAMDPVREIHLQSTNTSFYFNYKLDGLTFDGLTIQNQVEFSMWDDSAQEDGAGKNITFRNCTFLGDEDQMSSLQAVKVVATRQNYNNLTVEGCTFTNYFQGVYTSNVSTGTFKDNSFTNLTHNAIALQNGAGMTVGGKIEISGNTFKDGKDRCIRFGNIGENAEIVVSNNTAINSGDDAGEIMKAGTYATDIAPTASITIAADNNWGEGKKVDAGMLPAAEVDGKGYVSLQAAINDCPANGTVTLLKDVELTDQVSLNGKTLDLGGNTLSNGSSYFGLVTNGNATVKNGTIELSNAKSSKGYCGIYVSNGHTTAENLTIQSANYTTDEGAWNFGNAGVRVAGSSTFTLNANSTIKMHGYGIVAVDASPTIHVYGTVECSKLDENGYAPAAISGNGNNKTEPGSTINIYKGASVKSLQGVAIYHPQMGTLNINGGLVEGDSAGIAIKSGTLNVKSGATVSCVGEYAAPTEPWGNGAEASGAAIQIEANSGYAGGIEVNVEDGATVKSTNGNAIYQYYGWKNDETVDQAKAKLTKITITGGAIIGGSGVKAVDVYDAENADGKIAISGGTFSTDVSAYCAEGLVATEGENGEYTIGAKVGMVAQIVGGGAYETLAEAVAAAPNGGEVKLLKDVENGTGIIFTADKNLTVDFNGKTYTVVGPMVGSTGTQTNGFQLLQGGTVTLKNGMVIFEAAAKIGVKNYANLTIENLDITAKGNVTAVSNCGTLLIKGSDTKISSNAQWSVTTGNYNRGVIVATTIEAGDIDSVAIETPLWEVGGATVDEEVTVSIAGGRIGKVGKWDWRPDYGDRYENAPVLSNPKLTITGGTFTVDVSAYCAEGFQATKNGDTWSVAVIPAPDPTPSVTYYTLTIRYVDAEGNEVAPSVTRRLSRSSRYNVASPEVEGMVPDQETVSGVMGREDLTVTVTYAANEQLVDPDVPLASGVFIDVAAGDWFAAAVSSVYAKELMVGVTANTFAPKALTTRSMVATILHRMESEPTAAAADFSDVLDGAWYAPAVNWANETGLMIGVGNGAFGAEDHITREQLALTFYRYAQFKGQDVTTSGDLSAFADGAETSDWAKEAMTWAVESGLFQGKGQNILDPKADLTRAELAAILDRFFAEEK